MAQESMPLDALHRFLVPISIKAEQLVEYGPWRKFVKCGRANCTSRPFPQRIDPEKLEADLSHTTCDTCKKRDADFNNSESAKKCKATYRDANREDINKKDTERREERRNDPELHAHDQQVNAKYRAEHQEERKEYDAEYRAEHQEERKEYWDWYNKTESAKECKATYRDANREDINKKDTERREERRNDPELHAHDLNVGATYRAEHQEERAEYDAAYRAQPEHKDRMAKDNAQAGPRKATYKLTDKGVAAEERYRRSAAKRASRLRERQNGKRMESNARYRAKHREALKVKQDAWNHSPMGLLTRALYKMVKGVHWDPQSFTKLGSFATNEEAMAHFEERFDTSWMSWENQGRHVKGNAYNETWNIGHVLPRKIFNQWEQEDLCRCWHPDNLFPQCARQNTELRDALIYTDDELLEMRHLWPVGANDDLAQLKGLFQYVDHDFINSKLASEAGPSDLNDTFVSDAASSASD